jgi:hypothetical protein
VRSLFANLTQFNVPTGGPPDISIGADIPAAITAFYTGHGEAIISAILLRKDAATLDYLGLVITASSNPVLVIGSLSGGVVFEALRVTATQIDLGLYQNAVLQAHNSSQLQFIDSSNISFLNGSSLSLATGTGFDIDGRQQARGLVAQIERTTDSAAIGAETVVLTLPNTVYRDGRAFEIRVRQDVVSSAAGNFTVNRIRRGTTTAGAQVALRSFPTFTANTVNDWTVELRNTSGSNVTQQMVLTLNTTAGTTTQKGGTNTISTVEVWDIGLATDYPNRAAI